MPQPLSSKFRNGCDYTLGPDAMGMRPDRAVELSTVISTWAGVEVQLAGALCEAMQANAEPFAAAFQVLNSTAAQASIAEAAIKTVISDDLTGPFDTIMRLFWSAKKLRDQMAHGVWGWTDKLPDALLWVNPKRLVMREAMFSMNSRLTEHGYRIADAGGKHIVTADHVMIYESRDFDDAIARNKRLSSLLTQFGWCVWPDTAKDPQTLRTLLQQPEIAKDRAKRSA